MPPHIRRDVWKLPAGDRTLEWYGKAVEVLQGRPFGNVTSWWWLAAMHGIDTATWQRFGFPTGPMPPAGAHAATLWKQCQHATWYFLPWHRGYLGAFEAIVRDAIVGLGGPADWALPYWNYSDTASARELPRAFAQPTLPGDGKNFLYEDRRYGSTPTGEKQNPIEIDEDTAAVAKTLQEPFFEGAPRGSSGFGGVKTPFWHLEGGSSGTLESQPHNVVHGAVGGSAPPHQTKFDLGLMSAPNTAALDPIFWLHHANIDRLWNVWLRQPRKPTDPAKAFQNSTDPDWLDGPRDRKFMMPRPDGSTFTYTARDMLDTTGPMLDYVYDDDSVEPAHAERLTARLERLGATPQIATALAGAARMAPPKPAELIGASSQAVALGGDVVTARVRLDTAQRQMLSETLNVRALNATSAPRAPDRVFLHLENVKSPNDAGRFYVYVNVPEGQDPKDHPDHLAGIMSMFGASSASEPEAGGNGLTASFDITSIIDKAHLQNSLGDALSVKLVAASPAAKSDQASIGRISVYRQGQ